MNSFHASLNLAILSQDPKCNFPNYTRIRYIHKSQLRIHYRCYILARWKQNRTSIYTQSAVVVSYKGPPGLRGCWSSPSACTNLSKSSMVSFLYLRALRIEHKQLNQRVSSFPSSTSSGEAQRSWTRAQVDCPTETSWSCFRQRSKYRTVIVYDPQKRSVRARNRESEQLKGMPHTAASCGKRLSLRRITIRRNSRNIFPNSFSDRKHILHIHWMFCHRTKS